MTEPMELESERLVLRQWRSSDFEHFVNYFSDEALCRYVGGTKNQEEAWRLLASYIGHWQLKGFGYLAVENKETNKFLGCAGLWDSEPWPELELGYWFRKEAQGKGYASEAAQCVKEFAFNKLKVDTLVSYIHPENEASIKLAMRLGGFYDTTIDLLGFGPHSVYRYKK